MSTSTPSRAAHPFPPASTSSPAFPQHPHLHQRTLTSSSASSSTFPPNSTSPTVPAAALTLDALLNAHASSQDPKLAALEQAVAERNTLSSQNTQLWKLIEKQRAGYNQILKELERVRSERDGYKAKLAAIVGASPDRRPRKENGAPPTSSAASSTPNLASSLSERENGSSSSSSSSSTNGVGSSNGDSHTPRATQSRQQQDIATYPSFQSNSTATPPRQKSTLAPLLVPPRAESLPVPASAIGSATPENAPFSHASRLVARNDAAPSSSIPHTPPQHRQSPGVVATPQTAIYTPQTAPAGFNPHSGRGNAPGPSREQQHPSREMQPARDMHPPQSQREMHHEPQPQITTTSPVDPPAPAPPPGNSAMLLGNQAQSGLSRESRISLPDEARQYIANMGDTPSPSPKVDAFAPRVLPTAPGAPPGPAAPPQSEFLDLEEEGDDEEDDDEGDDEEDAEDDVEDDDVPEVAPTQPLYASRRTQAAASDFPLPPPSVGQSAEAQANAQAMANTQAQALAYQQAQERAQVQQQERAQAQQERAHADRAREQQHQQQMQHQQQQQYQQQQQQYQQQQYQQQQQSQFGPSSESLVSQQAPLQPQRHSPVASVPASFRALPLISTDLPHTNVTVSHSFVRPNDRGKEVLSFVVFVDPGNNKEGWKVEKMYSDVLALDQRVRNSVGKSVGKKMASLPEGKLWKDHAPAKVDQRKAILQQYLQALVNLPVKNNDEVIAFFTSDIVREYKQPVMQAGHKEGYLTKRGKNFGGWKTRFFVLQGPVLEYYDCRGGAHLGSITVTGAQIGRQQRSERPATDEEKEYRHAFLIVEAKKGPGGNHPRHVLCAESDADRDSWVEMLVRYFSGAYSEEPVSYGQPAAPANPSNNNGNPYPNGAPRPSADINPSFARSASPARSIDYSPVDRSQGGFSDSQTARRVMEQQQRPQPSSLPDSSPLSGAGAFQPPEAAYQRANSEQGHYADMQNGTPVRRRQHSPEQHRTRDGTQKGFQPTLNTVVSSPITSAPPQQQQQQQLERQQQREQQQQQAAPPSDRVPDESKVKISGPLNGAPIPAGYKFGGKDAPPPDAAATAAANERREKAKSRSFWGFGRPAAGGDKAHAPAVTFVPRAVFGVTLEESLDVAQIANLPAIVFRSIQYLEAKKADQEEGIYRLSGSSAVIKSLKDRFNMEGDIDLVGSDEYWDPHAIAGLLKSFLRELPASILTHNLHLRFLAVIDFVDPQERIRELSQLIAALPIANYSLLRALTAHLILIVQNSSVNKMTMRNVGIVFSPTLGIPAGVFSLMLGEFNRVFNVDADGEGTGEDGPDEVGEGVSQDANADAGEMLGTSDRSSETHRRRNSRQYTSGAADQLLGLSGRSLTSAEEGPSDDDSVAYESGTETTEDNVTIESSNSSPGPGSSVQHDHGRVNTNNSSHSHSPETPTTAKATKAAATATFKGLNVSVNQSSRGNRYSTIGLPMSPRPPQSPRPEAQTQMAPS